ncbi:MAG: ABC transporter ATP-binding protein [Cryomorphaceae bacterium]|nr:ABC transporter ATP-binding protein [Cryomorphaceae bacterium]
MSELVSIHEVSIGVDSPIVNDLNLTIEPGERLGLVGESGSGKTLSALSLAGLLPGNVRLLKGVISIHIPGNMIQIPGATEKQLLQLRRQSLGFVFQEPMSALNPVMRCGDQLMENLKLGGKRSEKLRQSEALSWLNKVRLPNPERVMRAYPHELSGGQRQRLMIAMALCNKPKLLIADEPTTALDVKVRDVVLDLMDELCRASGTALLLISHDLQMVAQRCQTIAVMQNGICCEYGRAEDLVNNPKHPYTKALWACRPNPEHRLIPLPTVKEIIAGGKMDYEQFSESAWTLKGEALRRHPALLKARDVHFSYGSTQILRGVDFDLYPGESLGILGESGCGKSTLSRIICGLESIQKGTMSYRDGESYLPLEQQDRMWRAQHIQMIFQDAMAALNPNHRVGRILGETRKHFFPGETSADRKAVLMAMMEKMDLPTDGLDRFPHSFSGGQRQRICIARALLAEPRILICDESVAALDVSVQAQILNLLHKIRTEGGVSFIFISHDPKTVHYFCHRVLQMEKGKFIDHG